MASIAFQDVKKSFDGVEALRGVSATVPDGRFVVLLGPSGCGKSTLLRLVAGLEELTSGDITIDEQSVTEVAPRDRGCRDGVSELRPLPAPYCPAEPRLRTQAATGPEDRDRGARIRGCQRTGA